MGRQEKCKQLRKKLFNSIGKKDRSSERQYDEKSVIYQNALGYRFKRTTLISKGLHRNYRVLKNEI